MKYQPKANNNHVAVVVCAIHVVKRPSKRMRASTVINAVFIVLNYCKYLYNLYTLEPLRSERPRYEHLPQPGTFTGTIMST